MVANSLFITWKLENNLDLDQGNWRKLNEMYERKIGRKEKVYKSN